MFPLMALCKHCVHTKCFQTLNHFLWNTFHLNFPLTALAVSITSGRFWHMCFHIWVHCDVRMTCHGPTHCIINHNKGLEIPARAYRLGYSGPSWSEVYWIFNDYAISTRHATRPIWSQAYWVFDKYAICVLPLPYRLRQYINIGPIQCFFKQSITSNSSASTSTHHIWPQPFLAQVGDSGLCMSIYDSNSTTMNLKNEYSDKKKHFIVQLI